MTPSNLPPSTEPSTWQHRLLETPLRSVARAVYDTAVALELAGARLWSTPAPRNDSAGIEDVTAVVKTFERPAAVRRLLRSMQRRYPTLHTIVVDDSREQTALEGVERVRLPFDSGVSAGRAEGLARVKTRFTLMLDDDFVFHRHTRLERPLAVLRDTPSIDLVAGRRIDLPLYRVADVRGKLWPNQRTPRVPLGSILAGLPVVDKTPNCFLARTERLRAVDWDPRVKRLDHADFFTRALGELVCVQDHRWSVLHAPTPFARAYLDHRNAVAEDRLYLARKHGR